MTDDPFPAHLPSILVAIILGAMAWPSKAEVPACPLQVPAGTIKPNVAPPGWELRVMGGARLTAAGILVGPNDGSGYLRPDKSQVRRDGESEHFKQAWEFGPPPDLEKWLYCRYGGGLELYKRLPDRVKACTMTSTVYKDRIVKAIRVKCDL